MLWKETGALYVCIPRFTKWNYETVIWTTSKHIAPILHIMKQVRRGQNVMPNSRYLTRRSLTANVTAKHYRPSSILPQNNTYLSEFYRETSADLPDFYRKPFRPFWILTQNITRLVIYLLY